MTIPPIFSLVLGRGGHGHLCLVFLGLILHGDVVFVLFLDRRAHQAGIARDHGADFRHHAGGDLELFDHIIRADHGWVGLKPNSHAIARLDQGDMLTLVVDQEVDDPNRGFQQNFFAALARAFFFQCAQHLQAKAVVRPDQPGAVAMAARLGRGFQHAGAQALAAHLHQAKARDTAHLNAGAVGFQLVFQALFDGGVVLALFHVDKIDHDQTGKVAQTQLAGDFFGGFKVGLGRRILDRAFLGCPARVYVDGNQRFGHADHDITAGFQLHRRVEHAAQIAFDLKTGKKRHLFVIGLHRLGMAGHDHLHEVFGDAIAFGTFDQNFINLAVVEVADRAFDQIALFIDLGRRDGLQRQLADLFPKPHQIFVIAFDLGLGALGTGGADDQARAFRHLDLARDFL